MRIASGVTDQLIYFVAVDATDFTTRETGLATWTVYRSRNGGTATIMTTPTVAELSAANMPGVYSLLLDEDMTIDSGDDTQEMLFHITHAGMAPVSRTIELYRSKITTGNTLGVAADGDISGDIDGAVTTVSDKTGYRLSAAGVDDVWDEAGSGHVTAGSFGAALYTIRSATAQAGAASTITLDASASSVTDFYENQHIHIVAGTGVGQGNTITTYDGGTKIADVQDSWKTNPSSDSVFVITPFGGVPGASAPSAATVADAVWDEAMTGHTSEGSYGTMLQSFHDGTAQAGTTSTLTLDASGSSAVDDFYRFGVIEIVAGTGVYQSRQITAYNGTSKVATVDPNWTTAPDGTSQYVVKGMGLDAATTTTISNAVWDKPRAENVAAGSRGEYVFSDALRISGSATAADGLEAAVSGATPLPANVTQVGAVAQDLPTATNMQVIDDNVDSVLVDTGTTLPATLGTPVADLATDIATLDTVVDAVQTTADAIETDTQNIQSRLPTSLNNGVIPADVQRINDAEVIGDGDATPWDGI